MTKPSATKHKHDGEEDGEEHKDKKPKVKEEDETSPRKYNLRHTPQRDDHPLDNHHPAKSKSKEKKDPSVAADGSDMLKLLWNTSTSGLLMDQEVFSVERKCPLLTCFKGLAKHQYYSCPVLTKKHQFFNFVDVMDVTRFTAAHFASEKENLENPNSFWESIQRHKEFAALTVDDLTKWPNTRRNWCGLPIPSSYSLLHVAELMTREASLHRLAIVDNLESRNLKGVVTQSQLVHFIWENMKLLGQTKLDKQVKDFKEVFHEVFTINRKATTLDAFQLISEKNVTGIPVVDDDGNLAGAVSIKDVKGMAADGSLFWRLYQPIHAYMDILHQETGMAEAPLVYCTKADKFSTVIDRLVFNKVHRVPVVEKESDMKVIGIITMRDVLRMALLE